MPGPQGPPLTHLLFADDCILLSPASVQNAAICSAIIKDYCWASGQKVNLDKSSICFSPSVSSRSRAAISQLTGIMSFSERLTYLGTPISGRRPTQQDFSVLDRRLAARMNRWQVSGLSMMGRITLIRTILTTIPIYMLSNALIPTTCIRRIERRIRDFLWGSMQGGHGIHLLAWDRVCLPRNEGGLGIQSLVLRRQAIFARHASRFLLDPHCFWSTVMRGRYGSWPAGSDIRIPRGCSFLWRAICQAAPSVLDDIHWMIGNGNSVQVVQDSWLADTPFSRWPTFISDDIDPTMLVSSLINQEGMGWNDTMVRCLFGTELAQRILAMPLPYHAGPDLRLWRLSCLPCAPARDLAASFRPPTLGLENVAWIWKMSVHPRVQLFLWKIQWDRLPTCSLLADRGLSISPLCPICGKQEETVDHVLFLCPHAYLIWQRIRFTPWLLEDRPARISFLQSIRMSSQQGPYGQGVLAAYVAYHIWLSRNKKIFTNEIVTPMAIFRGALFQAEEYTRFQFGVHSEEPGHWDPPAALAANRSAVYISWASPPPGFVKVNFDGSVSKRHAGSGFVIRGSEGQLLAVGGHSSMDISVPRAELQAAWAGISYAVHHLGCHRLIVEGDSMTVIRWMRQEGDSSASLNPLIRDIVTTLESTTAFEIRHIYREANAAADYAASVAARRAGRWIWQPGIPCPIILQQILYSDLSGLTHARVV